MELHKGIEGEEEDIRIAATEGIVMDMDQITIITTIPEEEPGMNHPGEAEVTMTVIGKGNSRSGIMNSQQGQEHTEMRIDGKNPEGTKEKRI